MLGEDLVEGLMDVSQFSRIESGQRPVCKTMRNRLLERLGTELAHCRNNRETAAARELLGRLKGKICLEIPENMQYVMEAEASLDLMEGKITGKEFAAREEMALRCTLDIREVYGAEETYLTEMEMTCIRQRIQWLNTAEKRKQIDFLLHYFENCEKEHSLVDYIAMYC